MDAMPSLTERFSRLLPYLRSGRAGLFGALVGGGRVTVGAVDGELTVRSEATTAEAPDAATA